jgi:hypothetical protein
MLTLLILGLLIAVVLVLSHITREKDLPVKCCDPRPWPPSDIDARYAASEPPRELPEKRSAPATQD